MRIIASFFLFLFVVSTSMANEKLSNSQAFISVQQFGARGDGKTDDTKAIQKALDFGGLIVFPKGMYITTSTLYIRENNTVMLGHGPFASIVKYEGEGAAISTDLSIPQTIYWCRLAGLRIDATKPNQKGPIIQWSSMEFGEINDLWIVGNAGDHSIGIALSAVPKRTEATYNSIIHSYIGMVHTGIQLGYGANSNTIETSRIQPVAGGVGIYLKGPMSNNRIINTGFEYPGNVSGGIWLDGEVNNTLLQGNRFESLAYAWKITGNSNQGTFALGNYYDSITPTARWLYSGVETHNLDLDQSPRSLNNWTSWIPKGDLKENVTYTGHWRDVPSDTAYREYEMRMIFTDTPNTGKAIINLPEGQTIDVSRLESSTPLLQTLGEGTGRFQREDLQLIKVNYLSPHSVILMTTKNNNNLYNMNTDLQKMSKNNEIVIHFKVPILH